MRSLARRGALCCLALTALVASVGAHADPITAMRVLREGGCGGILPAARDLLRNAVLDRAAADWAGGHTLSAATLRSGYDAEASSALHITGPDSATLALLKKSGCRTLMNQQFREIGLFRRGTESWLILTSASASAAAPATPTNAQAPLLASRALQLVNEIRARGTRCGGRTYAPAPPVRLSGTLAGVALGHASDMAQHNYFEHEDLSGHSPADRVRAVGYQEKLVGENIAYGPKSADEVVQGWLDSPGHCENIMDPRFAEMGIAFAPGRSTKRGLYWVQLLVLPEV